MSIHTLMEIIQKHLYNTPWVDTSHIIQHSTFSPGFEQISPASHEARRAKEPEQHEDGEERAHSRLVVPEREHHQHFNNSRTPISRTV